MEHNNTEPKKTALHENHVKHNAKLIKFFGWYLPVQYKSIILEHKNVRENAGLFDVSHMGQIEFIGEDAFKTVQNLFTNDASKLEPSQSQYTVSLLNNGYIIDDLILYCINNTHYLACVNASNITKDFKWFVKNKIGDCEVTNTSENYSQIALQGPKANDILQKISDYDVMSIKPFEFKKTPYFGEDLIVARTGYTGEDGFELYLPWENGPKIWEALIEAGEEYNLMPIGLGARDTLRMEMKFCLYGNDINETTTPLEAGIGWAVKLDKGNFIGKDVLVKQKEEGLKRKLVGFKMLGKGVARNGFKIFSEDGNKELGYVTSGGMSPSTGKMIGIGYIKKGFTKSKTKLTIQINKKMVEAVVVKTPFYKRK